MFQRILAPIDGSKSSERAISQAVRIARIHGGQVRLVHIFTGTLYDHAARPGQYPRGFLATLRGCAEGILTRAYRYIAARGIPVEQILVESNGDPAADSIIVEARQWKADLIVLGAHGHKGGRPRELGTDASAVLRKSPIPVILVRSAGGSWDVDTVSAGGHDRPGSRAH